MGEDEQFLGHGGIIRLYSQDARLRFAINAEAASRAGVTISSSLLGLAQIARGKP
ncbi:MAG TPA: YfiR family protein [Terriglobales bacterium]|nr:YfiR family protein [Terriglobales bacterium]